MAPVEMMRLFAYVAIGFYALNLSLHNQRMFGFGLLILCCGFSLRMGASLLFGLSNRQTGMISTIAVLVCLAAMGWDIWHDKRRSKC